MIDDVYNAKILGFSGNIGRIGRLEHPDATATAHSKLCGSTVTIDLKMQDGVVTDFAHEVKACALGQASSSIMAQTVVGASSEELRAVRETMLRAAERARNGEGPTLVESLTYRFRGHSITDPAYYRTRDEETHWRSTRDPIALFEEKLKEHGLITDDEINATNEQVDAEVEEIARFAEESPVPDADELFEDVLADGTGAIAWRNKPSTPRD